MSMIPIDPNARSRDFVRLASSDEYSAYFWQLNRVFAFASIWYQKLVEGGNTEAEIVEGFLQKMLYTTKMLRLKHLYSPDHPLALDLNDSGFPHYSSIMELSGDLALQPERASHLPSRRVVQEMMLEEMLRRGRDPVELSPQMSDIQFNEELDGGRLILPFTPGDLTVVKNGHEDSKLTTCLFSWLCYDPRSNMPFVHIMAFDFDGTVDQLRQEYKEGDFLKIIRRYGDRVPPLVVLASSIDQNLPKVFPKILKRIQIGSIICPAYVAADDDDDLTAWLAKYGERDDFALFLEAQAIFSQGQFEAKPSGWFSLGREKQIHQIFAISHFDALASERQANEVRQLLMLPHEVLQQITTEPMFRDLYGHREKIAYTREGGVYVI